MKKNKIKEYEIIVYQKRDNRTYVLHHVFKDYNKAIEFLNNISNDNRTEKIITIQNDEINEYVFIDNELIEVM